MRASLLAIFCCLFIAVSCSPIHGIWNNLPIATPGKRMYGLYQHLPRVESQYDKRQTKVFWRPADIYVD